jgi:coenzyme F420 hydrogenase subunit beta
LDQPGLIPDVLAAYGPALELWEGYAVDPEIRLMGSSGGVLTALGQYCIERAGMHGVLHIAGDPSDPVRNRTRLSRTRADLMAATGSRYAPASACDQLRLIESAPAPCAFVGQPGEATALRKVERLRPELQAKVGVILSFFCAGSPSTQGTQEFLHAHGFSVDDVAEIRYRGRGWPGWFSVLRRNSAEPTPVRSYAESWGFLQAFRPLSVNLTPDGSGEDADISCGDPWYRPVLDGEAGRSMVVVRTQRGRDLLRAAWEAGYVHLEPMSARDALASQVNLIRKRGAVAGRVFAMRLMGVPAPTLGGFSLLRNWLELSVGEKIRSTIGTAVRVLQRGLRRPRELDPAEIVRRS